MGMTVERFRRDTQRRRGGRKKGATPYSAEERTFALSYVQSECARGRSVGQSAGALGVSEPTLREWLKQAARPPVVRAASESSAPLAQTGLVRSVVVKQAVEPVCGTLTLVTPSGYRLSGLDCASAAALLRALS